MVRCGGRRRDRGGGVISDGRDKGNNLDNLTCPRSFDFCIYLLLMCPGTTHTHTHTHTHTLTHSLSDTHSHRQTHNGPAQRTVERLLRAAVREEA